MQMQQEIESTKLVTDSLKHIDKIATLLDSAANLSRSEFHTARLQRLAVGFRSLHNPLERIAGHLQSSEAESVERVRA
jgi:hypothetical protein